MRMTGSCLFLVLSALPVSAHTQFCWTDGMRRFEVNTRGTVARSDDLIATYSSRGPVGDPSDPSGWMLKPDLAAPGNAIVSTEGADTYLYETYPALHVTDGSAPANRTFRRRRSCRSSESRW